jgi:crotonobetainyl-CoA:carnitine CoA-transferase CaiB-like acyl-CoA transferase
MTAPLEGLKILDFSVLLPGPYATQMLADMGADVLRIESPTRTDMMRIVEPQVGGISAAHGTVNRNKRSLTLDLKQPEAVAIVRQLVAEYDIIVEQFRPGVMSRLGLGYEAMAEINPALIYCSITGYGQTGPLKDRAGHDINYLSLAGLASFSGRESSGPVLSGTQIADVAGGSHHAVMGILAAVIQRQASGEGQHIDISMSDAALALTTMHGSSYLGGGHLPGLETEMLNGGTFYDYYRTADHRYISVGSLEPQFFTAFFEAIGQPEWRKRATDPDHDAQMNLKKDIQAIIGQKPFAEWKALFAGLDACVEPVLTLEEVREHPHFRDRGMFVKVPAPGGEELLQIGNPIKFSGADSRYDFAGATLGAHNDEVLDEMGFKRAEIEDLKNKGVTR